MAAVGAVLASAAPYLLGASAGLSVLSGVVGAGQARAAGEAEAAAYKQQASLHEQQAAAQMRHARNQAAQERDKFRRLAAGQRAGLGASGVDVNTGSALDVLADTDAEGEVSAMQLLYSGELESWNSLQQARQAKWKAGQARSRAGGQAFSSLFGGLLSGVTTGLAGMEKFGLFDKPGGTISP